MQFEPPNALFPPLPADLEFGTYFERRSLLLPPFIVILGRRRKVYRNKVRHFCFLFPLYVLAVTHPPSFHTQGKNNSASNFFFGLTFPIFCMCFCLFFFISLFSTAFVSLIMLGTQSFQVNFCYSPHHHAR